MGNPIVVIKLITDVIRNIFSTEKTDLKGEDKKYAVLEKSVPAPTDQAGFADIIKYFVLASKLIDFVVKTLNDLFGNKGWGDSGKQ